MESIVILSIVQDKNLPDRWQYGVLHIQKEHRPKYYFFSSEDVSIRHNLQNVREVCQGSQGFTYGLNPKITTLSGFLGIDSVIDVRELALLLCPSIREFDLENLCLHLQVTIKRKYDAQIPLKDLRLTWEVLKKFWEKGLKQELGLITQVLDFSKGLSCQPFFEELRKQIIKQFPDRPIRTGDYFASQVNIDESTSLFHTQSQDKEQIPLSAEWVTACFQPGGLLSQNFPSFENRGIQATMAKEIINGLDESRNILIEAGTGTGKSMAYLIPALWWVKRNDTRIVIATHTITLQEQLYTRDVPFLHKVLPFSFKSALLKGKANYFCMKSFPRENAEHLRTNNERLAHGILLFWLRETWTGDLAELPQFQGFNEVWRRYSAENPLCNPGQCMYTSKCYLLRARKKAEEAHLIVVNHSLLVADIKTNHKILPEHENLIVDEAHNIHQTALKQLGFEISPEQMERMLDQISGHKASLIAGLLKNFTPWNQLYPQINWPEVERICKEVPTLCRNILDQGQDLFRLCTSLMKERLNLRVSEQKIGQEAYQVFYITVENITIRIADLLNALERVYTILSLENEQFESQRYEIIRIKNDLYSLLEGFKEIVQNQDNHRVIYLEKSGTIYLKHSLIDIAGILREKVFSRNNCTVLTSATLAIANDFTYFARDLGIENYTSLVLDSPFDYQKQMLLCVVNDMNVDQGTETDLAMKTASFIQRAAEIMDGRTLVLFTSHRYLRLVNQYLQEAIKGTGLKIFAQGLDGSRDSILHQFMSDQSSILLGTNSFWEGIDIPGDKLKCVIMVRLPFWPPDTPILEAKASILESQGLHAFQELHLPEAIIRFKQGFGRLIRTKEDRGVVIVLDDRIITKRYGRTFLKSLPITRYYQASKEGVIKKIVEWS